jgi:hypothetical protein
MNLYLVSGRVPGDDDDTAELIPAPDGAVAREVFRAQLCTGLDDETRASIIEQHGTEVFVCLTELVGEYLTEDTVRLEAWAKLKPGQLP